MAHAKTGQKARVAAKDKVEKAKAERAEASVELQAYTIPEFCIAHRISIDSYYRMQRAGDGPKIKKVGHGTRITVEAAKAWREKGNAATETVEAKEQRLALKAANTANAPA
ncbi:hypothetical protein G6321_00048570 [Bradyrhizobium barranii subsp. barranii]|uniref:Uncharacterized protein n=1 Tax=Bradyrhizobium barranii subsp. barranii TaxID=2823807 RepID=A0A7Z0QC54_9BRAD|nr:hypothetical protein [Bradyrhizobium barranii]UGX93375.1 hypothetical protein G6321_00048570 [Bradyrhizobium barranii subsp. barranii]